VGVVEIGVFRDYDPLAGEGEEIDFLVRRIVAGGD